MRAQAKLAVLMGLAGLVSGCMADEYRRADGLTDGAGDAVASNTVMQMVDPWPNGVQDTRLLVPAVRPAASDAGGSAGTSQSQTMSSSN